MNESNSNAGQSEIASRKNAEFFLDEHAAYKANIDSIDTYQAIAKAINVHLMDSRRILDIGNGGVFDYDTSLIKEIVGLDLFLDQLPKDIKIPENVKMVQGSALDIPTELNNFDAVLMVMLIHHLVGDKVGDCFANVKKSFEQAYLAAKPGGKLIVMDSCVPKWFFAFESMVYRSAVWVIQRTIKHPPVLQYTEAAVLQMMKDVGFKNVEAIKVPKGSHILQFGVKVPSYITPTQPTLFVGYK